MWPQTTPAARTASLVWWRSLDDEASDVCEATDTSVSRLLDCSSLDSCVDLSADLSCGIVLQ